MSCSRRLFCSLIAFALLSGCLGLRADKDTLVGERPPADNPTDFSFPVGYQDFHDNEAINFLLNRTYSLGYARFEDMVVAGESVSSIVDLPSTMVSLAEKAVAENRLVNAAFYYRAAEFYTPWSDPVKIALYDLFIRYFYQAFQDDSIELEAISYPGNDLQVMSVAAETTEPRGTIILHAGYDGFKEELYSAMRYLSAKGYDVINFDVPWMDRTRGSETMGFDYEWEKLISAVIDHFELEDVTVFGASFGGWLALRAAAFEPRISRVIASSVSFDVNQYEGWFGQLVARYAMTNKREFVNEQILEQMGSDSQAAWFFDHLMHVTNKDTPVEAAEVLSKINEENLHSELVRQDVLVLTGKDDHLVPFKMHNLQVKALTNAASVTPIVFTKESSGQNHCQVGNFGLAMDIVVEWLARHGG